MTVITIRLPEKLLHALDLGANSMQVHRAEYIRLAIEHMNHEIQHKRRIEKLKKASLKVRSESMRINQEFNKIERDPEDKTR
jgi:metal-responsive CopG/Arc/MetJ family transcriptional regulator